MTLSARDTTLGRGAEKAAAAFTADRERWILWLPVGFGAGIGLYFALAFEPLIWLAAAIALVAALCGLFARRQRGIGLIAAAVLVVALGLLHVQLRADRVAAPVLSRPLGPVVVSGRVVTVEDFEHRPRILLDRLVIARLTAAAQPATIRIRLLPKEKVAVGHVLERVPPADDAGLAVAKTRHAVAGAIRSALPGETGAVIAALIVGDRSGVSPETLQNLRDAGLAHLLAISGLHIGLVAATIFFAVRLGLALIEYSALRWPIKKIAAVAALIGSFGYLLLSGATVPTQRAFMMTGLVLLAVLLDRRAISLRLVAAAAMAVLLIAPESLLGPSFQMSFAAVVALVAFYEALGPEPWQRFGEAGPGRRVLLYLTGLALTTLIATVSTGLIALHHFGRVPHYGLLANLLAVPLTALWIMPFAVLAMLLMPFGLESWGLVPMGWGVDAVAAIAAWVAALPKAVSLLPLMPTHGLVAVIAGGLWLALWTGRKRWLGLGGIVIGVATAFVTPRPDILINEDGRLIAVRLADGELALSSARREGFTAKLWLQANGQAAKRVFADAPPQVLRCDGFGCLYRRNNRDIAILWREAAVAEECGRGRIIVASVPVPRWCHAPAVVDRFDLWRHGAHALYIGVKTVRIETVAAVRGLRPWTQARARSSKKK